MPRQSEHQQAARSHLAAFEFNAERHPDWSAVMLIYSALHLIEEACATRAHHNRDHRERDIYIRRNCRQLWPPYLRLKNESAKARYLQGGLFALSSKEVRVALFEVEYRKIRAAAAAYHLRPTPATPPATPPNEPPRPAPPQPEPH